MPLTPLLPGDPHLLGAFRLLGRLGQGGMGTVFLGVGRDERAVAVKVLREGPSDAEGRRRFRRELSALQRARGEHLVEVLGGDVDADTPWIVTRFVPGRRLDENVAEHGPLGEQALRRVARGAAEGIGALHAVGVVHRDLSPGNVLLVDGEPYVIDLGLAVVSDVTAHTRSGLVLGTAGYLAPEQVLGHGCTPAVDVHAWGATVAFAGTGRPPYGTGRPEAVLYRVVHDAPDLAGLPPALVDLVAAALAKEPLDRPLPGELLTALADEPAVAHRRDLVGAVSGPQAVAAQLPDAAPGRRTHTGVLPPLSAEPVTEVLHLPSDLQGATAAGPTAVLPPAARDLPPSTAVLPPPSTGVLPSPSTAGRPLPTAVLPSPTAVLSDSTAAWSGPPTASLAELPLGERAGGGPVPAPSGEVPPTNGSWAPGVPDRHGSVPVVEDGRRPGRVHGGVVAVPALLVVSGAACLAPVAVALVVLVALVLLTAAAGSAASLRDRQDRRGTRRRDESVAVLAMPWHLMRATLGTALGLPLMALAAVGAALLVRGLVEPSLSSPARSTAGWAAGVLAGTVVALARRRSAPARRLLLRATGAVSPTPAHDAALAALLLVVATGLLLVARTAPTSLWPLDPGVGMRFVDQLALPM